MTSTNDGKDVRSYQISGQKAKTYYIELYKTLESRLSADSDLEARTNHLCEAWQRVHCLCLHSAPDTHKHLISWIQRHTEQTLLQSEWQKHPDKHKALDVAIEFFLGECHRAISNRPSPPWERQLLERAQWYRRVLSDPWGNTVLKALLGLPDATQGTPRDGGPTDQEILEWLKEEQGLFFVTRLRQLGTSKGNDIAKVALKLASAVMERVRASSKPVPDGEHPRTSTDSEGKPTFTDILMQEAGFSKNILDLITDIEFVLLYKDRPKCIALAKQTPLNQGSDLVDRLHRRPDLFPHEKRLWKNALDVATLVAQVMIARCMVVPTCGEAVRGALYFCARALAKLQPGAALPAAAAALAAPAATSRHLHTLALGVHAHCKNERKPFVCELYIRAITAGMNELERLKVNKDKEAEARASEKVLSSWFTQLGSLLGESARLAYECALTAFSVHPSQHMYDCIRSAPSLQPVPAVKDAHEPAAEANSEFGSWATDSRSQTNFVKTSETLNIKKTQQHSNVLSTAVLNEGEALGLSPELCQDLIVLLSGPRVKTLSWDMDKDVLVENCRSYMERTHGGTKALSTELKYLNLDPSSFRHLPEEEDEDEGDIYYGIEKGYEHLVEVQDPEEVWEDIPSDLERTESCYSSDGESFNTSTRRKKKTKRLSESSEGDEQDPLSTIVRKSKSRPHSNGSSKERAEHSKDRSKERKKKERHKKRETSATKKNDKPAMPESAVETEIDPLSLDFDKVVNELTRSDNNAVSGLFNAGAKTANEPKPKKERKKREKKEKSEKTENKEKKVPKKSALSRLVGKKVIRMNVNNTQRRNRETETDFNNQIFITDSDYDSQKSSIASVHNEGNDPQVLFDGHFDMDEIKSPERNPAEVIGNTNASNKNVPSAKYENAVSGLKISNSHLYKYPNTNEQAKRSSTPVTTKSNDYSSFRCTPYYPKNDIKSDVKLNIKRLLEFRKQRSATDLLGERKQNRPEHHIQNSAMNKTILNKAGLANRVESRPRILSGTPKAISVPNIPKVFINKQQSEQLNILKKEVDTYFLNKTSNAKSETNLAGSGGVNLNRQKTQTTRPDVRRNNEGPPPPWDKSMRNINTYGNIEQKVYNTLHPGGPVKVIGNVTSKLAHQSNLQVKQNVSNQNAVNNDSNRLHDFVKDLHRSINAGVTRKDIRLGGPGHNKEIPSTSLSNPPPLSYCAKQIKPQKKVENAPNTFARLNYLHKNKQGESLLKHNNNQISQNRVQPKIADNKVVNIINEQTLTRSDSTIMKKIEKNTQRKAKSSKECQITPSTHSADRNAFKSKLIFDGESNDISVTMPSKADFTLPKPTMPTNIDQNELLLLLRQQSKLNQTRPIRSDVVINKGANITQMSKTSACCMPSALNMQNLFQRGVDQIPNQPQGAQGLQGLLIQPNKNLPVQIENVRAPSRSSNTIKTPEKSKSSHTQQKITTGKVRDLKVNSKGMVKNSNEPQDWERVMEALLAHKTPSRGPNALDMVLHSGPSQAPVPNNSLREQRIRNYDSSNNIHSNNTVTSNKNEEKVVNCDKTAKQSVSAIQQKPRTCMGNTPFNDDILSRKNIFPKSNNTSSVINEVVPLMTDDKSATKNNQTVIIKKLGKVQEIHIPLETFKKDLSCGVPQNRVPSETTKMNSTDLIQTETDPSLNDILPNFSDYDLLEELMDDDLRQEIGELLSDEEGFSASNIKASRVKSDTIKPMSTNASHDPGTAQYSNSCQNQTGLIKQSNIQPDTKIMGHQIKPLSTCENANIIKNKPVHVMYVQDNRKSQSKVQHNTESNALKNVTSPVLVQSNVQPCQSQQSIINSGIKNQSQFVTMDLSAPPNITYATNFVQQANINSGHQNTNSVRPSMTNNQNTGNIYVNTAVTHQPIHNVVLIRPEIVYEQYTAVQVHQLSDSINPSSSCSFNRSSFVTVPNISIYGAQFAKPVINPVITDPVPITHTENITHSAETCNNNIYSEQAPCSKNNAESDSNMTSFNCSLQNDKVDPCNVQETPMDLPSCFSEQGTKTKESETEEVKLNTSLSSDKNEVLTEVPKQPEQICSKTFNKIKNETKIDDSEIREHRVKRKRKALLNRQIHFVSNSDAIPLTYAPIITQKRWVHKRNSQTIQNNIGNKIIALGYKPIITNASKILGDDTNNVNTKKVNQENDCNIKMLLNKVDHKNENECSKMTLRDSKRPFDSYRIIKTEYQNAVTNIISQSNVEPEKDSTIKMLLGKSISNENKNMRDAIESSMQPAENIILSSKKCDDKTTVNYCEKDKETVYSKENNKILTSPAQAVLRSSNKSILKSDIKYRNDLNFHTESQNNKNGKEIVEADCITLRSSNKPSSKSLLQDRKCVKKNMKQQEQDDVSQLLLTESSKQDIEIETSKCVPNAQSSSDCLSDDNVLPISQFKQSSKIFKARVKLKLKNVENIYDMTNQPSDQISEMQKEGSEQITPDVTKNPKLLEEQLAGSIIVTDGSQTTNNSLGTSEKWMGINGTHQSRLTVEGETDFKNRSTDTSQGTEFDTTLNSKPVVNEDINFTSEPSGQHNKSKEKSSTGEKLVTSLVNTIKNVTDKSELNMITPYVNLIPNNISHKQEADVRLEIPRPEPIIVNENKNANTRENSKQKDLDKSNEVINKNVASGTSRKVPKVLRKHRRKTDQDQEDLIDSLRDKITIKELPRKETDDPLKRFISIKLSNGNSFKATVSGKLHVDIDSLFKDPAIRSVLLNNLPSNSRCILNVQQLTTMDGDNLRTEIIYPEKKNLETINLISDDEEDTEIPTVFQTEFGKYSIRGIDRERFNKHQSKFSQKCSVTLTRCKMPEKVVSKVLEKLKNLEAVLPHASEVSYDKISPVIEIDDSSNDSLEIVGDPFSLQQFTLPENIQMDLQGLKETLLQDLCVDMADKEEQKDTPLNNLLSEEIVPDINCQVRDLICKETLKEEEDKGGVVNEIKKKQSRNRRKKSTRNSLRKKCISSKRLRLDAKKCDELRKQYEELNIIKRCLVSLSRCDIQYEMKKLKKISECSYKVNAPSVEQVEQDSVTVQESTHTELSPCKLKRSDSFSILNNFDFVDPSEKSVKGIETKMSKNSEGNFICHSEWCMTKLHLFDVTKQTYLIYLKLNSDDISTDCDSDLDSNLTEEVIEDSEKPVHIESQVYQVPSLLNLTLKYLQRMYIKSNVYEVPSLLKLTLKCLESICIESHVYQTPSLFRLAFNCLESTVLNNINKRSHNLKRKLSLTDYTSVDSKISKFNTAVKFSKESKCKQPEQDNNNTMYTNCNSKDRKNETNISTSIYLDRDIELNDQNVSRARDINEADPKFINNTVNSQQNIVKKHVLHFYIDGRPESDINTEEVKSGTEETSANESNTVCYGMSQTDVQMQQIVLATDISAVAKDEESDIKFRRQEELDYPREDDRQQGLPNETLLKKLNLVDIAEDANIVKQRDLGTEQMVETQCGIENETTSDQSNLDCSKGNFVGSGICYHQVEVANEISNIKEAVSENEETIINADLFPVCMNDTALTVTHMKGIDETKVALNHLCLERVTNIYSLEQTHTTVTSSKEAKDLLININNTIDDISSDTVLRAVHLDATVTEEKSKILVDSQQDVVTDTVSEPHYLELKSKTDGSLQHLDSATKNLHVQCQEVNVKPEKDIDTNNTGDQQEMCKNIILNSCVQLDGHKQPIDIATEQTVLNILKNLHHFKKSEADAKQVYVSKMDSEKTSDVKVSAKVNKLAQPYPVKISEDFGAIGKVEQSDSVKTSDFNDSIDVNMLQQLNSCKTFQVDDQSDVEMTEQPDSTKRSEKNYSPEVDMLEKLGSTAIPDKHETVETLNVTETVLASDRLFLEHGTEASLNMLDTQEKIASEENVKYSCLHDKVIAGNGMFEKLQLEIDKINNIHHPVDAKQVIIHNVTQDIKAQTISKINNLEDIESEAVKIKELDEDSLILSDTKKQLKFGKEKLLNGQYEKELQPQDDNSTVNEPHVNTISKIVDEQYVYNQITSNMDNTSKQSLSNILKQTETTERSDTTKDTGMHNCTMIDTNISQRESHTMVKNILSGSNEDKITYDANVVDSEILNLNTQSEDKNLKGMYKASNINTLDKDTEISDLSKGSNNFEFENYKTSNESEICLDSKNDLQYSSKVLCSIESFKKNEELVAKNETVYTENATKHISAINDFDDKRQNQKCDYHTERQQENVNNLVEVNDKQNNTSSKIQTVDEFVGNGDNVFDISKRLNIITDCSKYSSKELQVICNDKVETTLENKSTEENKVCQRSNVVTDKICKQHTMNEIVDTSIPKNITLMYEGDSRIVLKGSIIEDAVVGTCYVFPIVDTEILSSVINKKDRIVNPNTQNEYIDQNKTLSLSECCTLQEDKDLIITKSKSTYFNTNLMAPKRGLKRKPESVDSRIVQKKYRKGKNIDYPKITVAAVSNYAYSKEFQKLSNYCSSIKFSYARDYHLVQLGDIHKMLEDWPIKKMPLQSDNSMVNSDYNLFVDDAYTKLTDPMSQTLADEISATYKDTEEHFDEINETNFSMGFGEWSGRVNQNFGNGRESTKFMAATLSDVKQYQPFSLSNDTSKRDMQESLSSSQDQLQKMEKFYSYLTLRDKVRAFFKETAAQLNNNWTENKQKSAERGFDTNIFNSEGSVFDMNNFDFFEPFTTETTVQVVQVGQLPVSAAAQNPVTCDPRVTQVTDADLPQCSIENDSPDDMEAAIKTEYTELTTADISLPLMPDYNHHRTLVSASQVSNLPMCNDNITIETEVKIEVLDEDPENIDENNCYEDREFQTLSSDHVANSEYTFDTSDTNSEIKTEPGLKILIEPTDGNVDEDQTSVPFQPQYQHHENGSVERPTDQLAHAMTAAGILTSPESVSDDTAMDLSNSISRSDEADENSFQTSNISGMSLQHALSKVLPQNLNQTTESDHRPQVTMAPQILHFVHGKNTSINQITLADNTQQSVVNTHPTPVFHIVQSKSSPTTSTSNESSVNNSNSYGGLSLVDASLSRGNNQLLHIVNAGAQKTNNPTQVLKRVNLLTNVTNAQGANEQKMVQLVCKSTDGKGIQLNTQQRSMVLRLHPIEPTQTQSSKSETQESNISNTESPAKEPSFLAQQQVELKSRSVYEENYAQFIQNCNKQTVEPLSLPKFNQAFIGKPVFQEKSNEIGVNLTPAESQVSGNACQSNGNSFENTQQVANSVLLRKPTCQTSQPQQNLVQQIKQAITPMNIQTMHGSVIYTRQIPVNIGGGQTINLITVPNTERAEDAAQKQKSDPSFGTRNEVEQSFIKIVPQNSASSNAEISTDETNNSPGVSNENAQNSQAPPILTQMRIKLPMLSKNTQMVTGARVVRPSFFQIQRNVIGGTNQPVYQQLVLTAAPTLGPHSIRLPQMQTTQEAKDDSENQTSPDSEMSSSTLREQLREFDMVLEQVKEKRTVQPNGTPGLEFNTPPANSSDKASSSTSAETTQQILYSLGSNPQLNVAYVNRKSTVVSTPATSSFTCSPDSTNVVESPTSSSQVPATQVSRPVASETSNETPPSQSIHKPTKSKSKSRSKTHHSSSQFKFNHVPPKPSNQKPMEDEQTTQRILYILAEYKEQVENSPDKDKPAPRRRTNLQASSSSSSSGSKRKKSSSGSRRNGRDSSPIDDNCRTMGSEDSSCGTSQGDCNELCADTHSPQGSPRKVAKKLSFEQDPPAAQARPQPQRNVLVTDGPTIAVTRAAPGKPATAVLMPANYILPVSMVKSGQQIAIVTNRGPKILTVGGGEGGTTNALLLQRLIGPGLKPMLARPGIRHVRLPTAALQNLQAFHLNAASAPQPEAPPAEAPAPESSPPQLVETKAPQSTWKAADQEKVKPERESSPEEAEQEQEPWNVPQDYSYEETVRTEMDRTVLDAIPDRYSPDMEAERIFDKMFDVESKKDYIVESQDSPRCPYDIDTSDCDDKVVQRRDGVSNRHRLVSAASLRQKFALMEDELRLQKSLSEECEDLGVDSPSASDLFPEAELLFSSSPAHETHQQSHTPQPVLLNQTSSISPPDVEDQAATDHLISDRPREGQRADIGLGLEDVGIVTVSEDGRATISLDHEEFVRSHPNTTFHSELTDDGEAQAVTIDDLKARHLTSTIFHAGRAPATVLVSTPQTTVISQATPDGAGVDHLRCSHADNLALPALPALPATPKDDGLSRFDSILNESRELHLSTSSPIIHSTGNTTQVIRRVGYDGRRDSDPRYLLDDPDSMMAGSDSKMTDDSRETIDSSGDVDDDRSSPERSAELFWEMHARRSEARPPLDFSSDSDKCCKSPYDENNSTDSSGIGAHLRLDSVIKDARGIDRRDASVDDVPPLRTYPPKRTHHDPHSERSLSGKKIDDRCPNAEGKRRASNRGVVKRGCHCCNGSPAPSKSKKPRHKKTNMDF